MKESTAVEAVAVGLVVFGGTTSVELTSGEVVRNGVAMTVGEVTIETQVKFASPISSHVVLFGQGFGSQGVVSISHMRPVNPSGQRH